jgi:hypothetical protein
MNMLKGLSVTGREIRMPQLDQGNSMQRVLLPKGTPLGLCDTRGIEFKVGSVVRRNSEINEAMHGSWVDYEITLQGTVPLMSYLRSEKGEVLSKGYTACCLSDVYDMKMFVFARDSMCLRPDEDVFIQE